MELITGILAINILPSAGLTVAAPFLPGLLGQISSVAALSCVFSFSSSPFSLL